MRSENLRSAHGAIHPRPDFFTALDQLDAHCIEADVNPFALQNLLHLFRHVLVFMLDQTRPLLDNSYLAAETSENLPEFQSHVTAAHNYKMPRQDLEVQKCRIRQKWCVCHARHGRYGCAPSHVQENLWCAQ